MPRHAPDPRRTHRDLASAVPDDPALLAHERDRARLDRTERSARGKPKQIEGVVIQFPVSLAATDRLLVRNEAIRRGVSSATMIRDWLEPHLAALRDRAAEREAA